MAKNSPIEWCDHTFNPWWGCTPVSPGCQHCYAETWAKRYRYDVWGTHTSRRIFGERHWHEPHTWNKQATQLGQRKRVFCASMADVFENHPDIVSQRNKLWQLIETTPMLDWLLLTKRPELIQQMVPITWQQELPHNVWAMVSVENQAMAEQRIPHLLAIPAIVRGLSVEPLLAPVDLSPWLNQLHWVIVGGESGPHARPMHPNWVHTICNQCQNHHVPFFFKQWGTCIFTEYTTNNNTNGTSNGTLQRTSKKAAGRLLNERTWNEFPLHIQQQYTEH